MNKLELRVPCLDYELAADWYDNNSAETLLILPGYQSSKDRQEALVAAIAGKAGMNAMVLDLSGHGQSPFEISQTYPAQHLLELTSTFDWLIQHKTDQKISLIGTSYGGFQAAYLTKFRNFSRLVLRTPAIYEPEHFYTRSDLIPRKATAEVYRKDAAAVQKHPIFLQESVFDGKTLVVVHGEDEDVARATTDTYIESFRADAYIAEGMRHWSRDPANPASGLEASFNAISDWLIETK